MNYSATRTSVAHRKGSRRTWVAYGLSIAGAALLGLLVAGGQTRMAITLAFVIPLMALATANIRAATLATFVYLVFMGDLRRLFIPIIGWSGQDPLLLVGPVVVIFLAAYAFASRSVQFDTPLALSVLGLMVMMILQIFNPAQGGLIVGVAGAMFYLIPLLWFWVGRTYATPAFMKTLLFKVVLPLAVLAMVMGYYQTFFGYLPYQMRWYEIAGYTALGPEWALKPISFFASSTEHATYLSVAVIVLWAAVLRKHSKALLLIPFLFVAVFLVGSRGPVVKIIATCAGMWAVLGNDQRTWVLRGGLALLIGGVGMMWSLNQAAQIESGNADVQFYVERQTEGLLGATNEGSSARGHLGMMIYGFEEGFRQPLGTGLGSTTKAASKFGEGRANTEVDISNIFVSTGVLGGLLYLLVIFWAFLTAVRYWRRTRSMVALALLGLLALTFFGWLGGQYVITTLVWLCIGAVDGLNREAQMPVYEEHTEFEQMVAP